MAETLTTTAPQTHPSETTWQVVAVHLDKEAPSIKVTLLSNTGVRFNYMGVVGPNTTASDLNTGLSFINQGKFKTVQALSLENWLLKRIALELAAFAGTVTGTEF